MEKENSNPLENLSDAELLKFLNLINTELEKRNKKIKNKEGILKETDKKREDLKELLGDNEKLETLLYLMDEVTKANKELIESNKELASENHKLTEELNGTIESLRHIKESFLDDLALIIRNSRNNY
jgi:hypothetical protein